MDATSHETDERLELYCLGRLSDSDVIAVEEHLLGCAVCLEKLDEIAIGAVLVRDVLIENPVSIQRRFEWFRPQLAFAAALAMGLIAVVLLWQGKSGLAPVAALQLTAMRGAEVQTVAPARELDLSLGDAAGGSKVEVVDENGAAVWSGSAEISGGSVRAKVVKALGVGDYFVRVYDPAGRMLHEYGFRVKR